MHFILSTKEDTIRFSHEFALMIKENCGGTIFLEGELGTGKTFICNNIIDYLSAGKLRGSSPTFNIMKYYDVNPYPIYHFDLYRIKYEEELFELGLAEIENSILLIEWPQIAETIINPDYTLKLELIADSTRRCEVITHADLTV